MLRLFTILIFLILGADKSFAQLPADTDSSIERYGLPKPKFFQTDSGFYIIQTNRESCKFQTETGYFFPNPPTSAIAQIKKQSVDQQKPKLLTIHGNVSYEYFYRSKIDTPVNQQNFQQHTEKIYLDVLIKEKYPLKVNFTSRQSNSPYFKNFIDVNFNFDKYNYNKSIKQQILDKLKSQAPTYKFPELSKLEDELKKSKEDYARIKTWLNDPATLQKIVEERERIYYQKIKVEEDSLNKVAIDKTKGAQTGDLNFNKHGDLEKNTKKKMDSIVTPYAALYETKKGQMDSLEQVVNVYTKKADSLNKIVKKDVAGIKQKIYKATSEKELRQLAKDNGIDLGKRTNLEKQLAAIKTLSIGRSVLNYTELTAQNITVTGINVEYNPSYYVAFASGKIDYRFRDFLNRSVTRNNQYIIMGRVGVGDREKNSLIFSYFTGRKSNSNYGYSDSIKNTVNIIGYSLEAIHKKDENTMVSAEFAKSTKPVTGNLQSNKQTGALVKFNDQTNMGINIKVQTIIPETKTKLSGFFRKTGENFQSFSLFSYNTDQTAWLARADQSLLKNKITMIGMLRRNDFTNPFTDKTYKTSTVFKSIQVNIRFPKYPSVSVGYYPGTQLFLIDKEKIRESAYYILNGSVVYSYFLKGLAMNSTLVYNKYINEATDSGFIAYKGTNYYASQSLFLKKLQLQGGYAYSIQPLLTYSTLETSCNYELKSWLKIGFGLKYNKINEGGDYLGESIQLRTDFKKFGGFQLQYEKSYLPTISQTLYPVEIGRVSYYKNF